MTGYRDEINVQPHDFAQSALMVGGERLEGVEGLRVARDNARNTMKGTSDGFAWNEKNPIRTGIVEITVPMNSPANTILWNLISADVAFKFSFNFTPCPDMKVNNSLMEIDHAPLEWGMDVKMVTYTLKTAYLNYNGAGYALQQAA
jgi:hypothetical protein